jgi:hypothetical protein
MGTTAIWANGLAITPSFLGYGLLADFIGVEIVGDLDE